MTNTTRLSRVVTGIFLTCLALAGCRWTSNDLLLRTDLSARPFEMGFYALREDEEDTPKIGYIGLQADGWYRFADDREISPDDTYLMFEALDASGAPGIYLAAWADATCMQGACEDGHDFTYMLLTFDGKLLSSYMPDCDQAEDGALSPDRRAAEGQGRATVRSEGSREVCVFKSREGLFAAMQNVSTRYLAGSLDDVSHLTLQLIE